MDDIEQKVLELIEEIRDKKKTKEVKSLDVRLDEIKFGSIEVAELLIGLEDEFGIEIPEEYERTLRPSDKYLESSEGSSFGLFSSETIVKPAEPGTTKYPTLREVAGYVRELMEPAAV